MEKQIRNAGKRISPKDAVKGRRLPALPKQPNGAKHKAMRQLPDASQRVDAAVPSTKTFEVINGTPCFFIVIPCSTGNPDRRKPLYLVTENNLGGPERGVWQCQECGAIRYTRKAWAKHAGMISNIMGTCKGME